MKRLFFLLLLPALSLVYADGHSVLVDKIVIGVLTPLSPPGDVAAGQLVQRGGELAGEYINTVMGGLLDGYEVQIEVEDDAGTPENGVAGYRRLVAEGAVAVVGQYHSSVNLAVNEVANSIGVPVFATQASAKDITAKQYPIAFRTHANDPARTAAWLAFIEEQGFEKVALISEDTDYGIGLVDEMERRVKEDELELELNSIIFSRGTVDVTPQLLKIKAWQPDLVINIGVGEGAHLIIDQASTINLFPEVPMLASYDFPIRSEFWELHPDNGNGLYFISYFHPDQELSKLGQWFNEAYIEKYSEAPVYTAFNTFGNAMIVAQAINAATSVESEALIEALEAGEFQNWAGMATFPTTEGVAWHNWTPPLLILQYTEAGQNYKDADIILQNDN